MSIFGRIRLSSVAIHLVYVHESNFDKLSHKNDIYMRVRMCVYVFISVFTMMTQLRRIALNCRRSLVNIPIHVRRYTSRHVVARRVHCTAPAWRSGVALEDASQDATMTPARSTAP